MLNGEMVSGLVWWEGKDGWDSILASNEWPPDIEIVTAWNVRNIGDETAFFKVSFMGLESAGVLLSPGEAAWYYLYPITPSAGSYDYTLEVIADDTVIKEYSIQVITGEVPAVSLWPLAILGAVAVLGIGVALSRKK